MSGRRTTGPETRTLRVLAAGSWLIALVALIDWLSGNPTAPTGIVGFASLGVLLTGLALWSHRSDRERR